MVRLSFPRSPTGRLVLGLALLGLCILAWLPFSRDPASAAGPAASPWAGPVPVRVVAAGRGGMTVSLRAIGTVTPLAAVTVKSRVGGELLGVAFEEGQTVKKGQLLAEIDPALYRARLAQAEGQLQQSLAQLRNAETELARYQHLFAQDSIARQQVEAQEALVNQLRGARKSLQAQVDDARLQLDWTRIEAPIAGRVGLRRVDAGNLIAAGDADGLVGITQMHPIAVVFTIPEHELAAVRAQMAAGRELAVEAWDRDDRRRVAGGRLRTFNNEIDLATGTVKLKAEFANVDEALFPNQFVNVRLAVRDIADAIVIPADAVQFGARGSYVYVIEDGKAVMRMLGLGASDGVRVVVESGLKAGERVVLEGLDRLREGREVVLVDNAGKDATAAGQGG